MRPTHPPQQPFSWLRQPFSWLRRPWLARIGVIVLLLGLWEIAARWWVDPMFLAPPSRVVMSLGAVLETRGVPAALRITFWELGIAFVLAVAIGLVLGLAIGLAPFARKSVMPIVLLLYGTPQITILPLFILYFGIGPASKIAFGVTHGFFPIILAVVAGVQNIKPILLTSARSMGASRWQLLRHVVFPHMIPSFFAGMRLAMTGVLLGVLLSELYVSTTGIGYFTALFTQNFDPTRLFGLIAMLAAMAIALNEIVRRARRISAAGTRSEHRASMCHEHRQFGIAQDVSGRAAEDHLPQSALRVGALDHEVAPQCFGVTENRLAGEAAIEADGHRLCRHPVQLQIPAQLLPRRSGNRSSALDGEDNDPAGLLEKGQRKGGNARLLRAAVPGNQHVRPYLRARCRRRDQDRASAFEQGGFERGHARTLGVATRSAQHNHVKDPAMAADEVISLRRIRHPAA
jgi:ABC-type nitrate/sulfonate/bicarbonate transport system permease component